MMARIMMARITMARITRATTRVVVVLAREVIGLLFFVIGQLSLTGMFVCPLVSCCKTLINKLFHLHQERKKEREREREREGTLFRMCVCCRGKKIEGLLASYLLPDSREQRGVIGKMSLSNMFVCLFVVKLKAPNFLIDLHQEKKRENCV